MIKYLADRAATYVVNQDETADYEVLAYGYDVLFQSILVILLSLLIALPFGLFFHVLVARIALTLIRSGSGGPHARHRPVCIICSVLMTFAPSFFTVYLNIRLSPFILPVLFGISLLLLCIYAPADTVLVPIQDIDMKKKLKRKAIIGLVICFAAALVLFNRFHTIAVVIVITSVIVCCMIHPAVYRLMGCKKSISAEEEKTA